MHLTRMVLADAIPDATIVIATVISGPEGLMGRVVTMQIPGGETNKLKVGEPAAVALVNNFSICVSASPADKREVDDWFKKWNCN